MPEQYAEVMRPDKIRARWQDEKGKTYEEEIEGLLAVCLQHEMDHLNGVLFIDHLSRLKREMVLKETRQVAERERRKRRRERPYAEAQPGNFLIVSLSVATCTPKLAHRQPVEAVFPSLLLGQLLPDGQAMAHGIADCRARAGNLPRPARPPGQRSGVAVRPQAPDRPPPRARRLARFADGLCRGPAHRRLSVRCCRR